MDIQRFLIGLGLLILSRIGLGKLPGHMVIQRGETTLYFPLVTCIIISVVLSVLFWLSSR